MKIIITAKEALEKGVWPEVAEMVGLNVYALADGMNDNVEIELTPLQAEELQLIKLPVAP